DASSTACSIASSRSPAISCGALSASGRTPERDGGLPMEPAEVVVGGAGALRRDHARADRGLRRAGGAEHLALPRLDDSLQDLTTLAGLRICYPHVRQRITQLRVEGAELRAQPERALRDEAEAAPLE